MTTKIEFGCPSSGCYESHTAIVEESGMDEATTSCKSCKNNILAKTRDGQLVTARVM